VHEYFELRQALAAAAAETEHVLGFMWAGSAADTDRIDEWSDHDFFLIVKVGHAESFRNDLSWLPYFEQIAWLARESDHGFKVVYHNGQVLEFAVFDTDELMLARVNHFDVVLDRTDIEERVNEIYAKPHASRYSVAENLGIFYTLLLIGVGRFRRGEVLIAGQFVRSYAVDHLVQAVKKTIDSADPQQRDVLDIYRRVELEYPELGIQIGVLQASDVETCARGLMHVANSNLPSFSDLHESAKTVLSQRFGW